MKKIVDDIALLSEYVTGMQETTSSSQWCQTVLASPLLEKNDPVWESQHFREDDQLAKTAMASYLRRSPNGRRHQGLTGKVTGQRRDNFGREYGRHKCQSMLVAATSCPGWQVSAGGGLVHQQRQPREAAALLLSLDLCCGDGQAAAQFLTFSNT